jgi:CPA2 family monovalent cation:H+ antiporter-2
MLLFEDIALVPIIFLLGAMGRGEATQDAGHLMDTLLMGSVVLAGLMLAGRFVLPSLFSLAARTKSPEPFLAASLLVVIVSALATGAVGLSPIVGALIAGLLIAETDYHGEVEAITAPFKGLALGVFLITVGMSLDFGFIASNALPILIATIAVLGIKALVTAFLLRLMGARPGTATETGILMASPSETTLIVLTAAVTARLINPEAAQFWQIVTALGLTITPILALVGKRLGRRADRGSLASYRPADDPDAHHAIIVGFGRVGRLVADMLTKHGQPYLAIESDPDLVSQGRHDGYKVVFGDAAKTETLVQIGVEGASAVIISMDEPVAARQIVRRLRARSAEIPIIARARDADHAAALYRDGASHAVPETLESSLQLSEAVLVDLGVPMGPVIASIHETRDEMRARIMEEGELDELPKLKTGAVRERGA